jgi:hypothetical protein
MGRCPESGLPVTDARDVDDSDQTRCDCGAVVDTFRAADGHPIIDHHTAGVSS